MFTLHSLTENIRTIIKWLAICVGILFLLYLLFRVGVFFKNAFFPPKPEAPKTEFGKLPQLIFPQSTSDAAFTYSIDTISGLLPVFPSKVSVYQITTNKPNLLNLQRARGRVGALGFTQTNSSDVVPEYPITDSLYEWDDQTDLHRRLVMDINTSAFQMTSEYASNAAVLSARLLADEQYAIKTVTQSLSSMDILPEDIEATRSATELYRLQDGLLTSAGNLGNAQVIRVDLFQGDVDGIPLRYPDPPHSTMNFLVASGDNDAIIILANFMHQTIGEGSSTYPIKTTSEAFAELKQGKAYIGSYFGSRSDISIKNIYLAYYLGSTPQTFLQPVIVFEGNDGFTAYVSAVTDAWIFR